MCSKTLFAYSPHPIHFTIYDHSPEIQDFQSAKTACPYKLTNSNYISGSFCQIVLLILIAYFEKLNRFLPTCSLVINLDLVQRYQFG